jgi:hypothetical protein
VIRTLLLLIFLTGSASHAFDHEYQSYGDVLAKYVANGSVDYALLLQNRSGLDSLLAQAAEVSFEEYSTFSRARQLSFMINLYNAATLVLILDHYPVKSIKDIGGLFSSPWNRKFIRLFDHKIGLGHIEHDILRSEFKEPRIHFAIVCASIGCPHLINEPYLPDKLEQQLSDAEQRFLSARPAANYYADGKLYLSPIFKWFREDFGGETGVMTFAQRYFPEANPETKIVYTDYDWSLNRKEK